MRKLTEKAARKSGNSKRGSYIVEASVTLPVFILCVIALTLIISIVSVCETITFTTAKEVREMDLLAYELGDYAASDIADVYLKLTKCDDRIGELTITNFDFMFSDNGIEDLVALDTETDFRVKNPIGIAGNIKFKNWLLSRAFTGKRLHNGGLDGDEMAEEEESRIVVIFPRYGIRYHSPDCRYVKSTYIEEEYKLQMEREDAIRKGYTPCLVCNGGDSSEE